MSESELILRGRNEQNKSILRLNVDIRPSPPLLPLDKLLQITYNYRSKHMYITEAKDELPYITETIIMGVERPDPAVAFESTGSVVAEFQKLRELHRQITEAYQHPLVTELVEITGRLYPREFVTEAQRLNECLSPLSPSDTIIISDTPPDPSEVRVHNMHDYRLLLNIVYDQPDPTSLNDPEDPDAIHFLKHEGHHYITARADPGLQTSLNIQYVQDRQTGMIIITSSTLFHGRTTVEHLQKIAGAPDDPSATDLIIIGESDVELVL
jgi:hypothetical protein